MKLNPSWPKWAVRQGFACVFVQATSAGEAVAAAVKRMGPMGGWRVGPGIDQEVLRAKDYPEHARLGDYPRSVIIASRRW